MKFFHKIGLGLSSACKQLKIIAHYSSLTLSHKCKDTTSSSLQQNWFPMQKFQCEKLITVPVNVHSDITELKAFASLQEIKHTKHLFKKEYIAL